MSSIHKCCSGPDAVGYFVISRITDSQWRVTTPDRRTGGVFSSVDEAHRFARAEALNCGHAEVIVLGGSGLDIEVFDESRAGKIVHVDFDGAAVLGVERMQ